jgi:N-acetylneuraminic acid mutarotase
MFPRISNLFIVCIMLTVIGGVQQVTAVEMEAGTWTQKADMPTARYIAGSAVVDGKIYVIGGAPVYLGITAVVEEYDPAADTWTRRADMPTARQGIRAAAVDGIIYAIGGWESSADDDWASSVEAYDPTTDTWTEKADMPTDRSISAIAVVDGIIYVIGGYGDNNETLSVVEAYDPATDTWTRKADMPTARRRAAACVVDGRIYVFAGCSLGCQLWKSMTRRRIPGLRHPIRPGPGLIMPPVS